MTLQTEPPLSDHDLLAASVVDLMAENRAAARRQGALLTFFRRRSETTTEDDPARLTARQETEIEFSELWAVPAGLVRGLINTAIWVDEHFPFLRDLAADGRIDPYRVKLIAECGHQSLDTPEEWEAFARRMTPFLHKHLRPAGILACSHRQLRNRMAYVIKQLRAADAEERFRNSHALRNVEVNDGEHGISWMTLAGTTDQIQLAAHRLDLSARAARAAGDPRTLAQLRTDLALDLLINGETAEAPVPQYARPVVNLTVPVQTVMGLSDDPGILSGGTVVPAGLARVIAQRPGATWHRMLTDPAGQAVELSTERYAPTRPIWENVVGLNHTCFRSQCDHASTDCDLDHRTAWPLGPTSTNNLWPACRTDHRAKHAEGFAVVQTDDGGFALRTPAGFTYATTTTGHPVNDDWEEPTRLIQFSATELHEALALLREERASSRPLRPDLGWEYDISVERHVAPAA